MEDYFNIKEIYDVSLRATCSMEINGRQYEVNEAILKFDRIQLAPLTENKVRSYASGGYGNSRLIDWEKTSEVDFSISEGVISKTGLAILSNSLLEKKENDIVIVPITEQLETDENGEVQLKYFPYQEDTFFIYNRETGEKITSYSVDKKKITLEAAPYLDIIVDYTILYQNQAETLIVGKRLIDGYLKLNGKIRLKDDSDGHIKTGIIEIPRVKLMSDLSMRLGSEASPYVYRFLIAGLPVGERDDRYVCKITMLDSEIDSDI